MSSEVKDLWMVVVGLYALILAGIFVAITSDNDIESRIQKIERTSCAVLVYEDGSVMLPAQEEVQRCFRENGIEFNRR